MKKSQELKRIYARYNDVSVPDENFNVARNKAIIEETIREATAFHAKAGKVLDDQMGERIEAVAAYGCYRFSKGTKSPEDYFGKKLFSRFVGERIMSKVKVMETVNKLNGNDKFKNCVLL